MTFVRFLKGYYIFNDFCIILSIFNFNTTCLKSFNV